ncbi:hypothetical protein D3C78_1226140 [compost metagenome]
MVSVLDLFAACPLESAGSEEAGGYCIGSERSIGSIESVAELSSLSTKWTPILLTPTEAVFEFLPLADIYIYEGASEPKRTMKRIPVRAATAQVNLTLNLSFLGRTSLVSREDAVVC